MHDYLTIAIAGAASFLQTIALAVTGTWALANVRSDLKADLTNHLTGVGDDLDTLRKELEARVLEETRMQGEAMASLRQKINEVELWARDHFVRRTSFEAMMSRLSEELHGWREAFDQRAGRLEEKLDRLIEKMAAK